MSEHTPKNPDHYHPKPGESRKQMEARMRSSELESTEVKGFKEGGSYAVNRNGLGLQTWEARSVDTVNDTVTLEREFMIDGKEEVLQKTYTTAQLLDFQRLADEERRRSIENAISDEGHEQDKALADAYGIDMDAGFEGVSYRVAVNDVDNGIRWFLVSPEQINGNVARVFNSDGGVKYIHKDMLGSDWQRSFRERMEREVPIDKEKATVSKTGAVAINSTMR